MGGRPETRYCKPWIGFTLVELLVVVEINVILMANIVSSLENGVTTTKPVPCRT